MTTITTYGALPGNQTAIESSEKVVWFGREGLLLYGENAFLDSTAVDAANTPTTELRAGLLLGVKTSDSNLYAFDPAATDGTAVVQAILLRDISMLNSAAVVEDKYGHFLLSGGGLKVADLLIKGEAFDGADGEFLARRQLGHRFLFDDDESGALAGLSPRTITKATDYTVTAADNSATFLATTADCDFTLPTISAGMIFHFFQTADFELKVTSAAGNDIICFNDLAASSCTFTTAGEHIGASCTVEAVYVGANLRWLFTNHSSAHTLTVA